MRASIKSMPILFLIFLIAGVAYADEALRFADMGDFRLENGATIKDFRLGYRVIGELNAEKSNAVLFTTWFAGTTRDLIDTGMIGPGGVADTARFCVIAVDSPGNGVSTSPSNSRGRTGKDFPEFSILDMVNAEYLLLTRELHFDHIHAAAGISMGAMQALQWAVSHPEFFDKAVVILGTPRPASSDLLFMQAEVSAIEAGRSCRDTGSGMKTVAAMHPLGLYTPGYIAAHTNPDDFPAYLARLEKGISRFAPDNWEWQLKAIMKHDIYRAFGGSMEKAASAVRAKVFAVVSARDQLVNPAPMLEFSKSVGAQVMELDSDCGHAAFLCEKDKLPSPVGDFLGK